jgi:hypothetical protein
MIARHPKCPESLKKHYAFYIFDSLVKNPAVALLLLENPQAVKGVPYADWKVEQWLSDGFAPAHVSKKMAALQNRNFKAASSQKQAAGIDAPQLRNKGQKRDRIKLAKEAKRVTILADLGLDRGWEVRLAVGENDRASAKVLIELIKDPHEKVRFDSYYR